MPTVSVIIPAYNHEKFIRECIQSVLDQTYQDFEIIITDDGSTDHTVDVIENFDDRRIKLFKHLKNKGVSVAANNCLQHASGNYVAWLSSDDAWYPEKLAVQVKYLDEHPEIAAVFGKVEWIDEFGNTIQQFPYINIFNVENRTRYEWLRQFFAVGNCLSIPCSLVRRECYSEIGMFDPVLAGMPDFDLWVRICLKYDIMILDKKLIRNRWISDERNESGGTIKNHIRNRFEYRQVLNHYLKIEQPDDLLLIFPDAVRYGKVTVKTIPYFLARIAIASGLDFKMLWGLDVIYGLFQDEKMARVLEDKYKFTYLDFIQFVKECDSFRLAERQLFMEQVQTLTEQVAEKDRGIQSLTEQAQALTERASEKDRAIQSLTEQAQALTERASEKDRAIQSLTEQAQALTEGGSEKDRIIQDIQSGLAFRMIVKYRRFINLLLPIGTKRRRLYTLITSAVGGYSSKARNLFPSK